MNLTENKDKKTVDRWRLTNIAVSSLLSLFCFCLFLYTAISGNDPYNRLLTYIAGSMLFATAVIAAIFLKEKLSNFVFTFFLIFAFFAAILGAALRFYTLFQGYDKVIHVLFGYVGCVLGLLLACKLTDYKNLKPVFIAIFCFAVSLAAGALWEILEFSSDNLFSQTSQGIKQLTAGGEYITDVSDSILDLICNLGGAAVFVVHYLIHRLTGKNLLLKGMTDDFCKSAHKSATGTGKDI